jgi:ABC-2 type transport system permease protein
VVVFLLTVLVEIAGGGVEWTPLLFWLAALSGMELFFYSFAVCLGQFTGHILALPAFYGVFNCLVAAVYSLVSLVVAEFCFGYYSGDEPQLVYWLTPAQKLAASLSCSPQISYTTQNIHVMDGYQVEGLGVLGIYVLAAVVLTVCALLLYRHRHLETAGDVVAVRPMRPVFVYGVAFCSGLFFGLVTTLVLELGDAGLAAAVVIWGVAGYFVAQMLLEKSFRVFRRWQGAVAVAAVFIALFLVLSFDLTGFERRVPEADQVASVEISGLSSYPYDDASYLELTVTDPEIIQKVIDLHQAAADQGELTDEERDRLNQEDGYEEFDLRVRYTMKNGTVMWRYYSDLVGISQDENTEGTVEWAAWQLLNDRDLIWQQYGFNAVDTLTEVYYEDWDTGETRSYFTGQQAQALLEAVRADFYDGNIGVRRSVYEPLKEEEQMLIFQWCLPSTNLDEGIYNTSVVIAVQDSAARTLALLEEFGDTTE